MNILELQKENPLSAVPDWLIVSLIVTLSLVIYWIDTRTPWQYSVWLLYIFPLLLAYGLPNRNRFLLIPIYLTFMNIGGFYFDPKRAFTAAEFFNRSLGISILWITTALIRIRKRIDLQLQQKLADLRASNQELEQFAYVASHDLREPLRTIGSFTELLGRRHRATLGSEGEEFLDHILEGVMHMQKLIDSLLELSRIGRSRDRREWVDCNLLLVKVADGLKCLLDEKHASLETGLLPKIYGQESELARLFHNLIHNAVKFSGPRPPVIRIQASLQRSAWLFSVQDNGIGIDPAHFSRIFMLFQRLHGKTAYQGSGIGLAVCKKIVERHGGAIWLESVPGQGSTFYFTLRANPGGEHE